MTFKIRGTIPRKKIITGFSILIEILVKMFLPRKGHPKNKNHGSTPPPLVFRGNGNPTEEPMPGRKTNGPIEEVGKESRKETKIGKS
jgi:hypothetical protein